MAKGAYIGVDGVARKVKKGYVGVPTDISIYTEQTKTVSITDSNIAEYFNVVNDAYYFVGSGYTFTTDNAGKKSTTARTVLIAKYDITAMSFNYSYSSEAEYDKFTLKVGGTTVEDAVSGATTSKSYTGTLSKGQMIEFTYSKDSSNSEYDDQCTFSDMSITTTIMTQTGTETKPVARKIKKAYIGIGGVARPCWSGGELAYYGTVTALSQARDELAATTVGNYALFGGGYGEQTDGDYDGITAVDAYDTSLTRTKPDHLDSGRYALAATTVGNYALFGGGYRNSMAREAVDAYDTSLTHTAPSNLWQAADSLAATTVGNYALFAGGNDDDYYSYETTPYNTSLTRTDCDNLSEGRSSLAATTVGNYALFAGGYTDDDDDPVSSAVDAYDTSLTRTIITDLSVGRANMGAATVGNYALFAGGILTDSTKSDIVNAYNKSLTRSIPTALSVARSDVAATTVGDYALFSGGSAGVVDAYDTSLTRTKQNSLSIGRTEPAATTVGNYALFGGGYISNDASAVVDAYVVV